MIKKGKKRITVTIDNPEILEYIREHLVGVIYRDSMVINKVLCIVYRDMKDNPSCYN